MIKPFLEFSSVMDRQINYCRIVGLSLRESCATFAEGKATQLFLCRTFQSDSPPRQSEAGSVYATTFLDNSILDRGAAARPHDGAARRCANRKKCCKVLHRSPHAVVRSLPGVRGAIRDEGRRKKHKCRVDFGPPLGGLLSWRSDICAQQRHPRLVLPAG